MDGLQTTYFDDGSTYTWSNDYSYQASTESPYVNSPSAVWTPQAVNPAAGSWADVLKYGLARTIDAKTRPLYPENAMPYYQQQQALAQQQSSMLFWIILAGVAVYALA